ncbi:uncharacterized protein K452DRAFT_359437 [Aplosporella prunicola CBS 121167]|uniref:Uncharacterized protein n=1 Tax=Aplosporella prunicola CBS 121167 TaxID=1176127 RepID=A0A6A6BAI6_9PEZI|nr:uncharacterized protein K452DRAFT_359437 [Aplosporella prunicola CBS 121167]KAF2141036.1 hypothetical protein K452DRAFT_359437 [Aplosporella prunicola CBS 121167]
MPMNWTPEADAKLLVEIIKASDISMSKEFLNKVAQGMGGDCNAKTIQNRITRLKTAAGVTGSGSGTGSTPATPKKAATPRKPRQKKADTNATTPKRKRGKSAAASFETDMKLEPSDGDGDESPTKKVKSEQQDDNENDDQLTDIHMQAPSFFDGSLRRLLGMDAAGSRLGFFHD